MDIKETIQLNKEGEPVRPVGESFIRTMAKDMTALQKRPPAAPAKMVEKEKKGAPPAGLPVAEPTKKPVPLPQPPLPSKPIPSVKPELIPPKKELLTRPALIHKERPQLLVRKSRLKFALIGLGVIIIIGGFFYWWNYLRPIPSLPVVTHYQCQDFQCVSVEGEGLDQCQTDEDCQPVEPVEPTIPDSLISVDETKTIELTIGQENLLVDELKSVAVQEQPQNTFKRILVKLVNQTEKKYADLATLILSLGISLPENIISGGSYTLFFYSQPEGNRLGLVINIEEGATLVADLKNWEQAITTDLKPLLLRDGMPEPFTEDFQDNIYQWIDIRYINFPHPDLSIDYAIIANKLVLTTSRESMYATVDALLVAPADASDSSVEDLAIEDWQTYQNEEYGYEVNYPEDWFIELHVHETSPAVYFKPVNLQIIENGQPIQENIFSLIENHVFVLISIVDVYKDKTIEEMATIFRGSYEGVIREEIIISGREAIKMTWQRTEEAGGIPNETGISIFLESPHGDRLLIQTESVPIQDYQDTFDQILSSFKFIE